MLYRLPEPYPGTSSIKALREGLAHQDCAAAEKDPLNPESGVMHQRWEEVEKKGSGIGSVAEPGTHEGAPLGVAGSYLSATQVRELRGKTTAGR